MRLYVSVFILLFALCSFSGLAQDLIIKTNGEEIESTVLEINSTAVKYKLLPPLDGPVRSIDRNQVFLIQYANGAREYVTRIDDIQKEESSQESVPTRNYTSIGIGIGSTYSLIGLRIQQRFGSESQLGVMAGLGLYSGSNLGFSIGAKYFFWDDVYASLSVAPSRRVLEYGIINNREYYLGDYLQYGPHVLFGGDWHWGDEFGFGVNFALGADFPALEDVSPNLDFGLFLKW